MSSSSSSSALPAGPKPGKLEFSMLPSEIRNEIWTLACFIPRVIDLWCDPILGYHIIEARQRTPKPLLFQWLSHQMVPPSVLHVCRESRAIGLNYYSVEFGTHEIVSQGKAKISISAPPSIYVNWDCDIIFPVPLSSDNYESMYIINGVGRVLQESFPRIRRFAIAPGMCWQWIECLLANETLSHLEQIIICDATQLNNRDDALDRSFSMDLKILDQRHPGVTQAGSGDENAMATRSLLSSREELLRHIRTSCECAETLAPYDWWKDKTGGIMALARSPPVVTLAEVVVQSRP